MGSLKEIVDKKQKKKRNKKANDSDFSERVSLGSNFPAFNSLPSFTFLLFNFYLILTRGSCCGKSFMLFFFVFLIDACRKE